jgi:CDP-paratose 2-epimerase
MSKRVLITGGAGFIGVNATTRLLREGHEVVLVDNLSRRGTHHNLAWLKEQKKSLEFHEIDIRDADALEQLIAEQEHLDAVLHLAAQVAVTTSIEDPRADFEINALGTLNLLESIRASRHRPLVIYASTNKVYGGMEGVAVVEEGKRYRYRDYPRGIPESMTLDFHSPYGCSKGAADQYVRDYARVFDIPTVVFRQSCIYGPRQFGIEDQGWVAWFVIASLLGRPITIYGDGKQVRDLLYVDDLTAAYLAAINNPAKASGQIFNVGGGAPYSLAIWTEFGALLEGLLGREIKVSRGDWRQGDQPVYISDIDRISSELDWRPETPPEQGISKLVAWAKANQAEIQEIFA